MGHLSRVDALGFLRSRSAFPTETDEQISARWRQIHERVANRPNPNMVPQVREFSHAHGAKLSAIAGSADFQTATMGQNWRFALVDADKLVSIQGHVDENYSTFVTEGVDLEDTDELIDLFLTNRFLTRGQVVGFDPTRPAHTVLAPGYDTRILGPVNREEPETRRRTLGFVVGPGNPYVMVVEFSGRHILKNGYHRVYGAMKRGAVRIPCVLIQGNSIADSGAGRPGFFSGELVQSPNPALMSDFLSGDYSISVEVEPVSKLIRVSAEEILLAARAAEVREPPRGPISGAALGERASSNFRVEAEEWSVYALTDGSIIRAKPVMLRITDASTSVPGQHAVNSETNVQTVVDSPASLRGTPSTETYAPDVLQQAIEESDLIGTPNVLGDCTYILENRLRVQVKFTSLTASRTSKFDKLGNPVYLVQTVQSVEVNPV